MPAIIAAIIITLLTGAGTVLAAQGAQPTDALYGVRQAVEQVSPGPKVHEKKTKPNQATQDDEDSAVDSDQADDLDDDTDDLDDDADDSDAGQVKIKVQSDGKASPHTSVISGTVGVTLTKTFSDVVQAAAAMPGHSENGLGAKLLAAEKSLVKGNDQAAQHQVDAFIRQANAACRSGNLDDAHYNTLYADYAQLISGIGGQAEQSAGPCVTKPNTAGDTAATEQDEARDKDKGQAQGQGQSKDNAGKSGSAPGRARR